jgi:hypothetical protein
MSGARRIDPFSVSALRYHVPLVLGIVVCLGAGWFELSRAREGHTVAWLYAVEWPGFAITGVIIWWRVLTGREGSRPGRPDARSSEGGLAPDDPGLVAWRQYLSDVQAGESAGAADEADGSAPHPAR